VRTQDPQSILHECAGMSSEKEYLLKSASTSTNWVTTMAYSLWTTHTEGRAMCPLRQGERCIDATHLERRSVSRPGSFARSQDALSARTLPWPSARLRCSGATRLRVFALVLTLAPALAVSQETANDTSPGEEAIAEEDALELNLPRELELGLLITVVSEALGTQILYDEEIGRRRITVEAPAEIPRASLLPLLESALRMSGFVLVEAEVEDWYRIENAEKLTRISRRPEGEPGDTSALGAPVTEVFSLEHVSAQQVVQVLENFLSEPGGNALPVQGTSLLIVTEFPSNLERIRGLLDAAVERLRSRFPAG